MFNLSWWPIGLSKKTKIFSAAGQICKTFCQVEATSVSKVIFSHSFLYCFQWSFYIMMLVVPTQKFQVTTICSHENTNYDFCLQMDSPRMVF